MMLLMSAGTPLRTSQKFKLYGVLTKTIGTLPVGVLRPVDVGREAHAVLHRDHHAAFDDGNLLQLGFEILAALHLRGCQRGRLCRGKATGRRQSADTKTQGPAHGRKYNQSKRIRQRGWAGDWLDVYRSFRKTAAAGRWSTSCTIASTTHRPSRSSRAMTSCSTYITRRLATAAWSASRGVVDVVRALKQRQAPRLRQVEPPLRARRMRLRRR